MTLIDNILTPDEHLLRHKHNKLHNLEWSEAGHIIDSNIIPSASGTIDLGSISFAFDDAYIDKIYLENAAPTDLLQATTKQYVDITAATAAGADTQIQFNDGGFFAGDADLTWNKITEILSVDANAVFNNSGADRDFRIASYREPAMLFVDGSHDMVIIGNDTYVGSDSSLEIVNHSVTTKVRIATYSATNAESPRIYFHKSSNNTLGTLQETETGDCIGGLVFYGVSSDVSWSTGATIMVNQMKAATSTRVPSDMVFETVSSAGTNDDQFTLVNDGTIAPGGSLIPNASGTLDLGTIAFAFDDAYINKVYLEADPTDPLGAVTKQYVDNAVGEENLWDRAGTELSTHYATDNIVSNASGTQSVGTAAIAFSEGHFDTLEAGTSIYSGGNITSTTTITGGTLTDGTATITGGNITIPNGASIGSASYVWLFDETNGDISTTANVGIGTASPSTKTEILSTTTQLRLTHTDGVDECDFFVDGDGVLFIKPTSKSIYLGGGEDGDTGLRFWGDTSTYLLQHVEDDGALRLSADDATNYAEFEADGSLKFNGTATIWDDLVMPFTLARVPASNAPNWESFIGNLNAYTFEVDDFLEGTTEMLHGWKEGSTISWHIHWATNGLEGTNKYVKWEIEYTYADMSIEAPYAGDAFGATTVTSVEAIIPANTADLTHMYTTLAATDLSGHEIGVQLMWRIRRIASAGTAPAAHPFGLAVGIHYELDTVGSRDILAK